MQRGESRYPPEYKSRVFLQWYNSGRLPATKFILEIQKTEEGRIPNQQTLQSWIRDWEEDADALDDKVYDELAQETVASKVAMLKTQLGETRDLRIESYNWLKENIKDLSPSVAVRLWIESAKLERQISGIPEALEKMVETSDEELLEQLSERLTSGDIEILDADS